MKSLFSRFKPATAGPSSSRPSLDAVEPGADRSDDTVKVSKSRSFRRPRLPDQHHQPPTPTSIVSGEPDQHSHDYSTTSHSTEAKGLPPHPTTPDDFAPAPPPKDHLSLPSNPIEEWRAAQHAHVHAHTVDNVKKVAFQSPQRPYAANSDSDLRARASASSSAPVRFARHFRRASSPSKLRNGEQQRSPTPKDKEMPRSHSRSSSRASMHGAGSRPGSAGLGLRRGSASTSQVSLGQSPSKSLSTLTLAPSEGSANSAQSYIPLPESWSAAMDEELIANLGPRERARQEVLWEIVNSEER